ncbi:MAG TPA: VWA domain-containing protein [Herpetosiphon sp.]|uniref:von Willebrand factor type A n=1 Tax=Herpetosiphon aurantiacus (strain ATCC 23779 / DSM 785 / 114-95) TaxID=316274 RepID=A9AXC5_HERA2|nr:vWA domain-containing protein [Herpetosiphon sp.]ABX06845.1 von Willebrand factor type A [Herpetosiphon aurantiacus DSM 785]HBW52805.1 VWA domain-containing protein [Herpetosiphon sp.]
MTSLDLRLTLSRSSVPANTGEQVLYVLAEVVGQGKTNQRAPVHCVLLVDCSPSMRVPIADAALFRELMRRGAAHEVMLDGVPVWKIRDDLMDEVRRRAQSPSRWLGQAVRGAAERLNADDQLSIIGFAEKAHAVLKAKSPTDVVRLEGSVAILERGDLGRSTRLAPGLRSTIDLLDSMPSTGFSQRIVVLTDGFVEDEQQAFAYARHLAARSIPVSTIGLGVEFQEQLLMSFADQSGGQSSFITDPSDLPNLLDVEFGKAHAIIAQKARLDLRLAHDVHIKRILRIRPALGEVPIPEFEAGSGSLSLGSIEQRAKAAWLLELRIPDHVPNIYRLLRLSLQADDPQGQSLEPINRDVVVEYHPNADQALNPELVAILERVTAWRLQNKALEQAAQGDQAGATRQLQAAVTRLVDLGEHELAKQTAAASQTLQETGQINPEQTKTLRYATRRLTEER